MRIGDTRSGCPAVWTANTPMPSHTVNFSRPTSVMIMAEMNRLATGRADLTLLMDGVVTGKMITHTAISQWVGASLRRFGLLPAGNYTFAVTSPQANVWGCEASFGWI